MRILIDLQACQNGSRFRGIGRYTKGIVTEILKDGEGKHDYYLLLNGLLNENLDETINYFSSYISQDNILVWYGVGPVEGHITENTNRRTLSTILRDSFVQKISPDLVFLPTFFEGFVDESVISTKQHFNFKKYICVSTCHDLIPLLQRDVYLDPHPVFKDYYLKEVEDFKNSDGFLAVSESSKLELIKYLNIDPSLIDNTSEGVENYFVNSQPTDKVLSTILGGKSVKGKKIILYSGASDERKNHLKLIKAFSELSKASREQSLLVFAGGMPGDHIRKFKDYADLCNVSEDELIFTGRISDQAMIDLYSGCYLFVFPSWHEGFGLPALEAMACGAPVIVSNTSSLPEVVGNNELLFNPYDPTSIRDAIEKFIVNETLRNETAKYCYARSKTFSWSKSAKLANEFFEKIYLKNKLTHTITQNNKIPSLDDIQFELIKTLKKLDFLSDLSETDKQQLTVAIIKNFRPKRQHKRLYLDLSVLVRVDFATGVQRVTNELYKNIIDLCSKEYEIIPISYSDKNFKFEEVTVFPYAREIEKRISQDDLLDFHKDDIFIALDLNYTLLRMGDAIDRMKLRGCKVFFLVHDLLPLKLGSKFFTPNSVEAQYHWGKQLLKADGIICVSEATMKDVAYYLNMYNGYKNEGNEERNALIYSPSIKLAWSHHGADFQIAPPPLNPSKESGLLAVNFKLPTFVMVGSIEPRKGHLEVIETFDKLWSRGFEGNLVIVASRTWNSDLTAELIRTNNNLNKKLFWLKDINDTDLSYIYSKSSALIAASIDEGFGLPLIEATNYNLKVICRDIPVFREVGNEYSVFFKDNEELSNILLNWNNKVTSLNLLNNTKVLTWKESAENLLDIVLNDKFDTVWVKKENLYILPIASGKFGTKVGEKIEDAILSKAKAGLLIHGGYFQIKDGKYKCAIEGQSFKNQKINVKLLNIVNDSEKVLFSSNIEVPKSFNKNNVPHEICSFEFQLLEDCYDVEIYISIDEENDICINSFKISNVTN